jgi:PAS domain S-box-containing protein
MPAMLPTPKQSFRFAIAALSAGLALAMSWAIPAIQDGETAMLLLLAAVVTSTWLCGWRAGLFATALCAVGHVGFVLLEGHDFVFESIRLTVFFLVALLILGLAVLRQDAEESLASSETQLRAILENSLDPIGVSRDGIHEYVNPAYLRLFGFHRVTDLLGKSVMTVIAEDDRAAIQRRIERRCRGEAVEGSYETRGRRADGSQFEMEVHVSTYRLNGDQFSLVILRDITERKRTMQEKELLIAELRDALSKVKTLSGLLPTCAGCRKIRDEDGEWHDMENYITDHSNAGFSHGLCPPCAERLYPDVFGPKGNPPLARTH